MSRLKTRQIQVGKNADPLKNFIIETPFPEDGTLIIKRASGDQILTVGADNKVVVKNENWIPLPFVSPWTHYGGIYTTGAYYKDPNGIVHLKGLITGGAASSNVFTLPAGYRPGGTAVFIVSASQAIGRLDISSAGVANLLQGSGWIALDHISFRAEN